MGVVAFPNDCRALVVEPEPVQAVVLEIMLDELGCQVVGPVHSTRTALELVGQRRPSFALVDAHAPVDDLAELAAGLAKVHVPFALLAIGRPRADLDRVPLLRDAPRVARPFHRESLQAATLGLHRADLRNRLAVTERRIAEGEARLVLQAQLVERLAALGADTATPRILLRTCLGGATGRERGSARG